MLNWKNPNTASDTKKLQIVSECNTKSHRLLQVSSRSKTCLLLAKTSWGLAEAFGDKLVAMCCISHYQMNVTYLQYRGTGPPSALDMKKLQETGLKKKKSLNKTKKQQIMQRFPATKVTSALLTTCLFTLGVGQDSYMKQHVKSCWDKWAYSDRAV